MKKKREIEKRRQTSMLIKQENIFQKDFIYNLNHCFVLLPAGQTAGGQPQNGEQKSVYLMLESQ